MKKQRRFVNSITAASAGSGQVASVRRSKPFSVFRRSQHLKRTMALILSTFAVGMAHAQPMPLHDVIAELLRTNPRITAASMDQQAAQARIKETWRRAWTPTSEVILETGVQRYETESIRSNFLSADRQVLRVTQLLTDFDRSDRQVAESEAVAAQSAAVALATREGMMLEALTAHWSRIRAQLVLSYSQKSEDSVRQLTRMETSLVELGKGYESSVLQAKVQLASAEARRVRAEGALDVSDARVRAVFSRLTPRLDYSQVVLPIDQKLPQSLEQAHDIALKNNKQILVGLNRSQAIMERIGNINAKEFRPRLQLVGETGRRSNWDSIRDGARVYDTKVLVQFNYTLNTGNAGGYAVDAVSRDLDASVSREIEARNAIVEQVSIAWRNLLVARQNKQTLSNQVRIAATFLEMATAERQLGRRSLLDVLTAELSLINAVSDLVATEADGAIASLTLLQSMGTLDLEMVEFKPLTTVIPDQLFPPNTSTR